MDYEKFWSVNDLVKNRNNWSLSADSELLKHLQHLSKDIIDKTRSTLELLESFENDVDRTCLSVANIGNRFKSLSDTQFIENKIQECPETELIINEETKESRNKDVDHVSAKLKEALDNGMTVLSSHYDIITVSDSDSENEEPQEILLKSCNPFIKRRLPYIIGTNDFTKYDHLGLGESSSEDEEENESADEVIEEKQSYDRTDVLSKNKFASVASAQIIQISSSDSEDSVESAGMSSRHNSKNDASTTATNSFERNVAQSLPSAARSYTIPSMPEADVKKPSVIADVGLNDPFSPPPFPVKSNSNLSSDEEKSDSGNSVSTRSSDIPRTSPYFISSPSHTARSTGHGTKSNYGITDELPPNESSMSKPVEFDECARNSNTLFTVGSNSVLNSDLICHDEKKLSRALADEFKSKIFAKKNSVLPNRSSIESTRNSEDSKSPAKTSSAGNKVAVENVEKLATTSVPFHHPGKDDQKGIDIHKNDEKVDRNVSSNEEPHLSTLVSAVAAESSKRSLRCNNADDDDDDDDDSDDWFNRAVSSEIPRNVGSVIADPFKSSKLPSSRNLDESSAKETVKDVPTADPKIGIDNSYSVKEKSVCDTPQTKTTVTEAEDVKKKYSLFGSEDDDDDDDDYLFTKKADIASDKKKTNELYDILFNDSDIDDPIQALVEENQRRVVVGKSAGLGIFNDSEIVREPAKDSKIFNYSEIAKEPAKNSETFDRNYSSNFINDDRNVIEKKHGTERKVSASRATETDGNIFSGKIAPNPEAKKSVDDFLVSDIHSRNDESSKMSDTNVQIPKLYDLNFEKEEISTGNTESGSSESVLKSNSISSAVKKNTPGLSTKTAVISSQTSSNEFSPSASEKHETATTPFTENWSASSEIIPHTDDLTKANEGNSCEETTSNRVKGETTSCLKTTKPGKLAVGRGANVNINALLPTSKWSKPNPKKMINSDEMIVGDDGDKSPTSISTPAHSNLLSVTKNRTKIPSKRRPPTRRGRVAQLNAQPIFANSVSDESEPISKDLNESILGSNSVTLSEPFADQSTRVEQSANVNSSADVDFISAEAEDTLKNASCVGSANTKCEDVNSIFDSIFGDDRSEDVISNTTLAVADPANGCDLSSQRDVLGKPSLSLINPSTRENKIEVEDLFSGASVKDSTSSVITDGKKIESSNLWGIADSSQKSGSLSTLLDDDFIVANVTENKGDKKSAKNSRKTGPVFRKEQEHVDRVTSATKKDVISSSVSNVKSDLFGDDDDEDFNKLFNTSKKTFKNLPSKNSSLFADADEDDEDLFGVKASRPN